MSTIEMGVHEFLSRALRSGGLSSEFSPKSRAILGTAAHQAVTARRPENYQREVPVRHELMVEGVKLVIRGRIDGMMEVIDDSAGVNGQDSQGVLLGLSVSDSVSTTSVLLLEEIKSTYSQCESIDPWDNQYHLAQLQLYHHFECHRTPWAKIKPIITYVNLINLEERSFEMHWTPEESKRFFHRLAEKIVKEEVERLRWIGKRDASLVSLRFPFPDPRSGQTELVQAVENAIKDGRDLLAEASTGIGKTIGTIYPALKGLNGSNGYSRVFFLTAKSAGVDIALRTVDKLMSDGLELRVLQVIAKEKMCPLAGPERPECDEKFCPYAVGFYDKVEGIRESILTHRVMTADLICRVGQEAMACPYELALEMALWSDFIICDYNYAFDPAVYFRRFFSQGMPADSLFLVDEAHNLVPRGRDMYSADMTEEMLLTLGHLTGEDSNHLLFCLGKLLDQFHTWKKTMDTESSSAIRIPELPKDFMTWVQGAVDLVAELLLELPRGDRRKRILECYFVLVSFTYIASIMTGDYAVFVDGGHKETRVKILCLNPGPPLRERISHSVATIFFSATLSPHRYYRELLGAREGSRNIALPSPFPRENRLYIHVPDVSTKYSKRDETRPSVAGILLDMARAYKGNYLAFFPSYAYQGAVWAEMMLTKPTDVAIHVQRPSMGAKEQEEFLAKVTGYSNKSNLGLAVMGGLFGEGVDLPGEALVGTAIVGPGLPALSKENELIKEYFDERNGEGFIYSYAIPGSIKVIQAAGRVFRTPTDIGVVVLMDDRFLQEPYQSLLPSDWGAKDQGWSTTLYRRVMEDFWSKKGTHTPA